MAKIRFMSAIKEGSGRMEDIVFSTWKGRTYMKTYRRQDTGHSPGQLALRRSFGAVVRCWKSLGAAAQASWHTVAAGLAMTGYNAFMAANIPRHRTGALLLIAKAHGEEPLADLTATPGAAPGEIVLRFTSPAAGKHVTLFVMAKDSDAADGTTLRRIDCGANPAVPLTVNALTPAKPYALYAVVTNAAYPEAATLSESVALEATAS